MIQINVPDFWMLFNPSGQSIGSTYGHFNGNVRIPTEESAWHHFAPTKRERDRLVRRGYHVAPIAQAEWLAYWNRENLYVPPEEEK